ncbi:hypothetical protein ATHL_01779 [Anaerolinea thermolimosa]|uniref:hypothetical protein n=1 Tax=Anaerolinea thermolimosa TaxID=229919 RepID=UPI000782D5EF|nr:hypothetical protein [Anaerolinea thermolimosa]GAP06914.1 hypothetical protein ATHL_01779 [Anaerolinea thermolimosa]
MALRKILGEFFQPQRLAVFLFFAAFFLVGQQVYDDYGISWDEPTQLEIGKANYRYLVKGDPSLLEMRDRYYGPLFEIFLVRVMVQVPSREMYLSRHWWNFIAFFAGVAGFAILLERIYPRRWFVFLGCLFLVLTPRIFADAFYNSKDIPFLSATIWGMLALILYLQKPGLLRVGFLSLASAIMVGIRLPGIFLTGVVLVLIGREMMAHRLSFLGGVRDGLVYLILSAGLIFAFYPVLWHDPLGELGRAFETMARFPQYLPVLYLGQFLSPQNLPWHYLPVWMAITVPIPYLALAMIGGSVTLWKWVNHPRSVYHEASTPWVLAALWLFTPWMAVLLLHSALYDGWRQMYFLYPAVVLFSVQGWEHLHKMIVRINFSPIFQKGLLGGLLGVVFIPVTVWMIAFHPYQNVYFNRLAGRDMQTVKMRFDLDYWGLAYREGLESLLRLDARGRIKVFADTPAGVRNAAILATSEEHRLDFVDDPGEADYFIGNYRWHPADYPYSDEVVTIWVGNAKILSVFRLPPIH